AGVGEGAHRLAIGRAQVLEHAIELGIDRVIDRGLHRTAIDRRGRRDRDLGHALGMRRDELEMLDHRVAGEPHLAGHAHALVARLHPGKGNAVIHDMALDPVEAPEKIEVPPGAAELAVGDRLEPDLLLLLDGALDLAVFYRLDLRRADLPCGAPPPRFLQRRRTQQAADVVGAERRGCSLHGLLLIQRASSKWRIANRTRALLLAIRYSLFATPTPPPPPRRSAATSPTAR